MRLHCRGSVNNTQLQFSLETSDSAATSGPPATNESQGLISYLASGAPHGLITATWVGTPPPAPPPSPQLTRLLWNSSYDSLEKNVAWSRLVLCSIYLPERNDEREKNSSLSEKDLGWGNSDGDYEQNGGEGRAGGPYVIVQIDSESLQSL